MMVSLKKLRRLKVKNRIELHAKTKYSIDHESTIDIKELILKCASNGEKGVAIVDKDSVLGFLKAEKILKELNIKNFKLVYGIEVNVFIEKLTYKAVILLKKRNGLSTLYRMLSPYFTNNKLLLEDLMLSKKNFIIGLIYEQDNCDLCSFRLIGPFFMYGKADGDGLDPAS